MEENFLRRHACPVCNGKGRVTVLSVPFMDEVVAEFLESYYEGRIPKQIMEDDNYTIVKCARCGLLFQEFILSPPNMCLLYEEWISAEQSLNKKRLADISLFREYAYEIENVCKLVQKKPHQTRVLEYGMGWGYWSNMAKAFGFCVTGVEFSKRRIDFAAQNGLRVIQDLSQEPSGSYDYIYSNQTFEHIPNPREVLLDLTRILSPKGVIHIQVPNGRNIEQKLRRKDWHAEKDALHPLEHINCFDRVSLRELGKQADLRLMKPLYRIKCDSLGSILKSNLRYVFDSFLSTQVFFVRV